MHERSVTGTIDAPIGYLRPTAGRRVYTREVGGFVFAQATYLERARTPWHAHGLTGLAVVVDGGYVKRTALADLECGPGALTVEPPGVSHAEIYGPAGSQALLVEILPSRLRELDTVAAELSDPICRREGRARALGQRAYVELRTSDAASALVLESIALELIAIAVRSQRGARQRTVALPWLRQVTERLRDDFRGEVTLGGLAASAGVHPAHLARAFREREGCSVGEFVRRCRIEWAANQLSTTTTSISAVAQSAGFYDQSHFARVFKAHVGVSPARYRAFTSGRSRRGALREARVRD